jgi:hypothetical protein
MCLSLKTQVFCVRSLMMPQCRLRAWALSGLILIVAFAFALAECTGGMYFVAILSLGGIEDAQPGSFYAAIVLLIVGLVAILLLAVLAVDVVSGDLGLSLWRARHRHYPRPRLRTLMVAIAAFATFLGLAVFAGRAYHTRRTARFHADSAEAYRWLQGLDLHFGGIPCPRFPASEFWTPVQRKYVQTMGRYHQDLSREYYVASYHPWISVPPDPPGPPKPDKEQWDPMRAILWEVIGCRESQVP